MKNDQHYGKKGNQTLQKFLAMGFSLLIQKGISGTLLEDILTYCGLKKGSFYYYFESKEQFIDACFSSCYFEPVLQITQALAETPGQSFADITRFYLQVISQMQRWLDEHLQEHTVPLAYVYAQASQLGRERDGSSFSQQNQLQVQWVCATLRRIQQQGGVGAGIDCAQTAQMLNHTWGGVLLSWPHHLNFDRLIQDWTADVRLMETLLRT